MSKLDDTLFLVLVLSAFAIQQPATIGFSYALYAAYIIKNRKSLKMTSLQVLAYSLATLLLILPVANFKHGGTSLFYLVTFPLVIISANLFSSKSLDYIYGCLNKVFWIFIIAIAIGLARNWDDPEPLGAIIPGSSTNGLPSYLIVLQISLSITALIKYNRLPLLPAAATLVVAIFGIGRGSIITAALILVTSIFVNLYVTKSRADRAIFFKASIILLPIFCYYIFFNYEDISELIEALIEGSKFSGSVLDEHRGKIIADYLGKIDGWVLLFGTDYSGTSIVTHYGGNPHNSFIRAHSFYGILGLLLIILSSAAILIPRKNIHQKIITFIFVLLALMRASTEPIFFPSALDFFYCLYIFIYFKHAPQKIEMRHQVCLNRSATF